MLVSFRCATLYILKPLRIIFVFDYRIITQYSLNFFHKYFIFVPFLLRIIHVGEFSFVSVYLGKLRMRFGRRSARLTDERVRLLNEIITGIHVIKMYAWEEPFAKLVDLSRRQVVWRVKGRKNCFLDHLLRQQFKIKQLTFFLRFTISENKRFRNVLQVYSL